MEYAPTAEERMQSQEKGFAKLRKGKLFQVGAWRHFLAVRKVNPKEWEVIELTADNRRKIIAGQPPKHTRLLFNQMDDIYIQPVENG